nr:MAG TPA: hypothetical protein [Caudoviricetes sp.]
MGLRCRPVCVTLRAWTPHLLRASRAPSNPRP